MNTCITGISLYYSNGNIPMILDPTPTGIKISFTIENNFISIEGAIKVPFNKNAPDMKTMEDIKEFIKNCIHEMVTDNTAT